LKVDIHQAGAIAASVPARHGQPFLHLLFESGISRGRELCAGTGLCGKCRIRFLKAPPLPCPDDQARLGAEELADGWRLGCKHLVIEPCSIEVPLSAPIMLGGVRGEGLAVDIGTTRIKWALRSSSGSSSEFATINPQMGVGSEVMSRLRYALSSDAARDHLRQSAIQVLQDLVRQSGALSLAVCGNSTMIGFLLDVPLGGLAYAPYRLPWHGGETVRIDDKLPVAYIPPLLGPFIGADISAGLAYISTLEPEYPFLLADLGTNGEFVLALDAEHFFASSVPMGPAIEGVGLCCGATAGEHVLSHVSLGPTGLQWPGTPLSGVSGTGYASILALLRRLGVLDEAGHFRDATMPLARKISQRIRTHRLGRILDLEPGVFVAERDVEEFLKAKAGVNVALKGLVRRAGLLEADVARIYLAGALGEHADPSDLITLGFLPEAWRDKIEVAGNTALAGTLLALEREDIRDWLGCLPGRVVLEGLVEREDFGSAFMQAMLFAWI